MKRSLPRALPTASRRADVAEIHRVDDDRQLGQFIPLHYHGQMLTDERRMSAFREAIVKLVPEGSHVVELGAGTGVLSFFASQRARRVTCVERVPHVAAAARRLLAANGVADKVTVLECDARSFMSDEPVDVLICELLHVALLREKQTEVVAGFRARHEAQFGCPIARIIPEASILAAQLVHQPYDFHGYHAPVPLFSEPGSIHVDTIEMGVPEVYAMAEYLRDIPGTITVDGYLRADRDGTVNAIRFITKNVVGILVDELRSVDWHSQYMSLPLARPVAVAAGDRVRVSFQYETGGSIESLSTSLHAELAPDASTCAHDASRRSR
jgi:type I protein arginine methyltransferase